jgi:hypothetical protein
MRIVLDSDFHRERKELYSEFPMGELLGSPIAQNNVFATNVIVNFFDGGPRTSVEYCVGQRALIKMERITRSDPFVEEVFARNEATKKALGQSCTIVAYLDGAASKRSRSGHLVDEYGRQHNDHLIVEVTAV